MIKRVVFIFYVSLVIFGCKQETNSLANENNAEPNDLIHETSPYLLQHAYNPVDWKAWNDEALQLAKDQNKLIIISVGYSACHWCHVMEEESFENDSIAKLMNDNFINIKVDREERPDVDQIYMNAVQLMTGSGGWPLNCIALPNGRPVFGGTYFTKAQWTKILNDMSSLYKTDPEKVISYAERLTEGVKKSDLITVNKSPVDFEIKKLDQAVETFGKSLDFKLGGQNGEPKFPMPVNLNFLLRYAYQNNDEELEGYVVNTLNKMANGGIYDQIGGGFSRYSVDDSWHIPHFEKMLYDNAQLVSIYSKAYQLTKDENYKKVVEETLSFVDSELSNGEGAFYSSLDADSENSEGELEEGIYYAWTKAELESVLKDDFTLFKDYYNINSKGKWEKELYVLYKTKTDAEFVNENQLSFDDFNKKKESWKKNLKKIRNNRQRPRLDDKVLTSWNALMLKGYVDAYNALGDNEYLQKAIANAEFIKEKQLMDDGSLFHSYKDGKSTINGFSEDYAHVISAFIALYQVTFNEQWLNLAKDVMNYTIKHFLNKESSMFYFTSDSSTNLITRKTEVFDNVIPSSNSVLANCLFSLGHYYYNKDYLELSNQMLKNVNDDILKAPTGYANWLTLYLNFSNPYYEVALSGENADKRLKELQNSYLPNILISGSITESNLPLMKNKFIDDETLIYVCVNGACKLPVDTTKKALSQIAK